MAGLLLAAFLVLELPCRILLQPDPWLLHPDHWYFLQPLRLGLEALLVAVAALILWRARPDLLRLDAAHWRLVLIAMVVSALLFGLLEHDQLAGSLSLPWGHWLAWLGSGFLIGIGQELAYRGLLFSALRRWLTDGPAGWLTTAAFVLAPLHSWRLWDLASRGELVSVALLIAIYIGAGMLFQWLRCHTRSVVAPALVHGVGNAITWVAVFS
ncbi:CPBP family intramembrane glutamic endopeptidase [Pseudomarimonas arenosa]|uniref:CPBP family intramembrane metalloprotease n=1 Tax=Pseudomarimonas arenosa TaxID=2774145 RepID=A0AAW3ZLF7_9GAMM|nr:CPBP family intramembrane glutamic endopeptidase [Pseudomarimonas arenosa]MBD8525494.1 CPBP family intramembrane metalloprotease [Pseudomarimonas arenosa]